MSSGSSTRYVALGAMVGASAMLLLQRWLGPTRDSSSSSNSNSNSNSNKIGNSNGSSKGVVDTAEAADFPEVTLSKSWFESWKYFNYTTTTRAIATGIQTYRSWHSPPIFLTFSLSFSWRALFKFYLSISGNKKWAFVSHSVIFWRREFRQDFASERGRGGIG